MLHAAVQKHTEVQVLPLMNVPCTGRLKLGVSNKWYIRVCFQTSRRRSGSFLALHLLLLIPCFLSGSNAVVFFPAMVEPNAEPSPFKVPVCWDSGVTHAVRIATPSQGPT
jgi:hypothetical protein